MRGLEELAEGDKSRILPVVLFAPWVGSHSLERSVERIEQAYGNRPFFLDLDRYYVGQNSSNGAQREFRALIQGDNRIDDWKSLIETIETAMPILRHDVSERDLLEQIDWAEHLGRGYAFRFDDPTLGLNGNVLNALEDIEHSELAVFIDAGWANDPLAHEFWLRSAVEQVLQRNPNVPLSTSTSNFPSSFANIEGLGTCTIGAREVFNRVRAANNEANLTYGDWASTKPRSYDRGGHPLPRIDYATRSQWVMARSKKEEWDFVDAANAIVDSDHWNDAIETWGSYMIESTAEEEPYSIDTSPKAVAARINIHLHVQANFDLPENAISYDDPWID
ncbi:beta family protein [Pelagibacterium sp. HS1C4-1]|nr:beta family protein [Pelagibacterium xiamenense]